jgi:glycerophosphoryl diester phosphodiesterase
MFKIIAAFIAAAAGVLFMYLTAIKPRTYHRPDRRPFMGTLYAHRGLYDNNSQAPENSMAAFKRAVSAGYGIELDVQLSKDGIPVIFHDFFLKRMCHMLGKVSDYTYAELSSMHLLGSDETIPSLENFLAMVSGRVPLIIEYKSESWHPGICTRADGLLRNYSGVYCIESFNPFVLLWFRMKRSRVMRGQLSDDFRDARLHGLRYVMMQYLMFDFLTRPDFIAYNHKHYRNPSRRICRRLFHGLSVGWTIKNQKELEHMKGEFDMLIFDSFIPDKMDTDGTPDSV